jgi:outer membrane protein assembly factor BamB
MRDELGVIPHNMTTGSVLIVGDRLYAATGNGVDWTHHHIPAPLAPALICLDKKSGKPLAQENAGISGRTFHANWSSPTLGNVNGKPIVIFGAGDGFCYAFDPEPVKGSGDVATLKEIWRYDCNPPEYRKNKYSSSKGPSEIVATPVFHNNRVYVAIGQDPDHGSGVGMLHCIDATKTGDVTRSGKVWTYDKIDRTLSTAAIADGLLFIGDMAGLVHCLDADSGAVHWTHDTRDAIWGAPTTADGKVYVGNATGVFTILAASKEKKEIAVIEFDAGISSSPVVANGAVYVGTDRHLYAIGGPRK